MPVEMKVLRCGKLFDFIAGITDCMKQINKIQLEVANLEYNSPADCMELRLYLLSLMSEYVRLNQQLKDKQKSQQLVKAYRELHNLYENFTATTADKRRGYKAQFEFAKALVADQLERTAPMLQTNTMAVA